MAEENIYAYSRLMEVCQRLTTDVKELHEILDSLSSSSLALAGTKDHRLDN